MIPVNRSVKRDIAIQHMALWLVFGVMVCIWRYGWYLVLWLVFGVMTETF